ncbi:MAG: ATP-binding protein [Steroidobacteraceae bacterium]
MSPPRRAQTRRRPGATRLAEAGSKRQPGPTAKPKATAKHRSSAKSQSKARPRPGAAPVTLRAENAALRKTVRALMARVERAIDDQGSAFSWFQTAAKLEELVRVRTEQYESLNQRLTRELESRREIELALKQAKAQAEQANREKTRFLAAASHDLRQPLNSAVLFLEAMEESGLDAAARGLLQRARVALASLNNLLGTLLDVARLDSGSIEPRVSAFAVANVFDRIGPEFTAVARSAGIEFAIVPSRAWVRTDPWLLETVLRNLIGNAIRYTPSGRVLVGCRRERSGLRICVHDTGVGIAPEHLSRIFEAYYQAPNSRRARDAGIGLGLSIVHRIAQLLGLEHRVQSTQGRGSVFSVCVPLAAAVPAERGRAARAAPGHPPRASRPLNVVVIDDNAEVLQGMAAILGKWGHRPVTAATATDALVQLIGADLVPDLIVSDYHLAQGTKGDQAIDEVRRECDAPPPAIIITSDPDVRLRERMGRRGLAVLEKPVNLAKLRAMIERLQSASR